MRALLLFLALTVSAHALTIAEISDQVATANTNWNGLGASLKSEFGAKLRARVREAFDNPQRNFFKNWWLRVTAGQLATGNGLLPANVRVSARTGLDGLLYINADLLTDCQAGETYAAVRTQLQGLPLVRKFDMDWPAPAPFP